MEAQFLPPEFPFERRSSRPPGNPVNACISFGSALVYQEVVAAIHLRGLDPGLGLLHQTENDRWSLALRICWLKRRNVSASIMAGRKGSIRSKARDQRSFSV